MDGVGSEVTTITFVTKNMKMEGVCKKSNVSVSSGRLWYAITATKNKEYSLGTYIDQEHLSGPFCKALHLERIPFHQSEP